MCQWNNTCYNYTNPDDEFNTLFVFLDFIFLFILSFFLRLWEQISNITNSLSIILTDEQIVGNLTDLLSQIRSINNYINIWDGKLIK
jgi:hypothetical protein